MILPPDWILLGLLPVIGSTVTTTSSAEDAEKAIIRRAKAGDSRAFESLVVKHQRGIYHLAMRMMRNHQDADEVVQETFIKAYSNLESFSEEFKFYTWLYRIAMNTSLTMLKQRHRSNQSLDTMIEEDHFQPAVDEDVFREVEYSDIEARVHAALEHIHPDLRSVFVLRTFGDLSYKEISETLQVNIGTVMSRLNRVRTKLQKVLREEGSYGLDDETGDRTGETD